ncbi:MAG TPA: hypothetical protein PLE92_07000 [Lentisphaeria bacterium]|nr:hypothetical protein [Lentisphaeria bacterium]
MCCGSALLLGVQAFGDPLIRIWFGAYLTCLLSMLASILLVSAIRGRQPESPLRVWPYYAAIGGLMLLLILIAPLVLAASIAFM